MTQVNFRDGAPDAGTNWDGLKEADNSLKDFLTTTNGYQRLDDLRAFLKVVGGLKGVTWRQHRYGLEPATGESPSNYPLCYFGSWVVGTRDKGGGGALLAICRTRFSIWSRAQNEETAIDQVTSISGALMFMLKQTIFDSLSGDWSSFYSNHYEGDTGVNNAEAPEGPFISTDAEGLYAGRAGVRVTTNWYHEEL